MSYPLLLTMHLFAAMIFAGVAFFEVVILGGIRQRLAPPAARDIERAIGQRARRLMPWVVFVLYGAGAGMAWNYRAALQAPWTSAFATLLCLKILFALSVLAHVIRALTWLHRGEMTAKRYRIIHRSVFCHILLIVMLAKAMFHASW